jgi:hypothetical protein
VYEVFLVKPRLKILKESLPSLNNFLQEYVSPQTQDKASGDKNRKQKGNKPCHHEKTEPCKTDANYYHCAYF